MNTLCRRPIGRAAALLGSLLLAQCGARDTGESDARGRGASAEAGVADAGGGDWFMDRAAAAGLQFRHFNGASGKFFYPEILPPGVALFDYDNDGDLDAYLTQGRMIGPDLDVDRAFVPPLDRTRMGGRLFRNDLEIRPDGTRALRFADVTEASGIATDQYGLGVAAADVDNDGDVDLFLTNYGTNQLLRNNGDGTFTDVSDASGVRSDPDVTVSAAFFDYDRDGWLDLYVGYNVNYRLEREQVCPNTAGVPDYCPPQIYGGKPDRLYHNEGRGRFVDVSDHALAGAKFGPALGVAAADYDGDGWLDIYVANDGEPDLLWINQHDGTFRETGMLAGVALTADGEAEASMGVDAGDFDNDGDDDLVMTELTGQGFNLYLNDGAASFQDRGAASGLGALSRPYTGWGTTWFDFDNDGWLDLLTVNGPIVANEGQTGEPFPYDQRKLLLRNRSDGTFENVTDQAGAVFQVSEAGRGAAFGDVDNDGDLDVLIGNDNGPVRLLVNQVGNRNHWLGLRLVGAPAGAGAVRDMVGATVLVTRPDGSTLRRRSRSDGSYGSANDPRVLVGLGAAAGPVGVEVRWPDGRSETWPDVAVDRWTTLTQGGGR